MLKRKRYEPEEKKGPTEQEQWEKQQSARVKSALGFKSQQDKQYELITQNQIEFVQSELLEKLSKEQIILGKKRKGED